MSTSESSLRQTEDRRREMQDRNRELGRRWSAIGWGLFLVLVGGLVLADGRGWLHGGEPWLYFAIGIGAIFIIGFLAQFFKRHRAAPAQVVLIRFCLGEHHGGNDHKNSSNAGNMFHQNPPCAIKTACCKWIQHNATFPELLSR